jgi:porphobilinogen synthase
MPLSTATGLVAPWSRLRLRQSEHLRDLCSEISFTTAHLIQPIFIVEGLTGSEPIAGLDGNARLGLAEGLDTIGRDLEAGVRHFLLFAVPSRAGSSIAHGVFAAQAVEAIKRRFGARLCLWVDICLCSSTADGHCAISDERGRIDLTSTLNALGGMTVRVADAGADGVSPSDMMDGRTAWMRRALDDRGHGAVPIMSYSTKFASNFYGPFREAAGSAPRHGNRAHYQIDVRSRTDAIASSIRCANEGADLLMVKPGMTSLDLIGPIREATGRLVGAYQVSGEYAGLCALAREGLTDADAALLETWYVFRRAGAAYIITYGARRARAIGMPA